MDFQSINKFTVTINLFSGNLFPLTDKTQEFSWAWKIYAFFSWIVEIIYVVLTTTGLFLVPKTKALQDGTVNLVVIVEALVLSLYVNCRRNFLKKLIKLTNQILSSSDKMKIQDCIKETNDPIYKPFRIYVMAAMFAVIFWTAVPLLKIMEKDQFSYIDYREPLYLIGEPFTTRTFVCGVLLEIIGGLLLIAKKIGIDVYMVHTITLLTSEYRYISNELENIFGRSQTINEVDHETNGKSLSVKNDKTEKSHKQESSMRNDLKKLIRHHGIVTQASQMLKNLLSLNVAVTYCNCIFRFCFLAFMIITIPSAYFDKCLIIMYTAGALIQVYILCFCVQTLLEASTTVTDNAFYQEWYNCDLWSQRTYAKMMISKNLECRITAFGTIDLTINTFVLILKQSYSACLFFLKMNS